VALATSDGLTVYKHFGQADEFQIADIEGDSYDLVERRKVPPPCEQGTHDTRNFDAVLEILPDCEALFVGKAGPGAQEYLAERGIRVFDVPGTVEAILGNVAKRGVLDGFRKEAAGRDGVIENRKGVESK